MTTLPPHILRLSMEDVRRQAKEEVKEAAKLQVVITAGEEVWLLEVERQVVMSQLIR